MPHWSLFFAKIAYFIPDSNKEASTSKFITLATGISSSIPSRALLLPSKTIKCLIC